MSNLENFTNTLERPEPFSSMMLESAQATLPKHLAELPGGQWALWRWVALRGAGFPAELALQLAAPECAAAARKLVDIEDAAEQVRRETVVHFKRAEKEEASEETQTAIRKVLRGIWKGKLPRADDAAFGSDGMINALRSAYAGADALRASFYEDFAHTITRSSQAVYDVASSNLFQEAVIWQNRHAFQNGITAFLRNKPGTVPRNSARRTNEELIATYLQRYCMKNDTIGFFGPVGWAKLVSEGVGLITRPGASLLSKRNVHPERWCIDALTDMLNADESLRPWTAPRLLPFFRVEGTTLYHPFEGATEVAKETAAVLLASDGIRTAKQIALELTQNPTLNLKTEEEVFDVLGDLCNQGLILWALECPVGPQAEQHLLGLIERIGDESLRVDALATVIELRDARRRVAAAAGDAAKLDESIAELEDTFERLTGEAATRAHGEIYAGRTLVYEDCQRALDVEIGTDVLQTLGPPLSLLLDSARWFTFEAARRYREIFTSTYAELVEESGAETVEAVAFWHRVQPHVVARDLYILKAVMTAFQERWSKVLSLEEEDERRVNYTTEELRGRVREAFDAPGAGWRLGRYQCPDVMIAARSAAAIGRGDYQLVMGELHLGGNTLANTIFVNQHPSPSDLIDAIEADLPEPCMVPIPPRQWPTVTARTVVVLVSPKDYRLALSYDATSLSPEQVLPISAFVVEESGGGLVVRTRDARISFDIVEFFGAVLSLLTASYFKILPPRKHTPRVTIDRLVVIREAWCFSAEEMEFAHHKEEADRFVQLHRWAREHGMPRFVFIKVPIEPKPFYVDFESPILVNFFTKTVRQTLKEESEDHTITVTEMIPTPDQLWVTDAAGKLYTAELRMVAIEAPV
jgi:hypothetical protein